MLKVDHHDMYVQNTVLKTARINRHGKHRTSKAWRLGTRNSWSVSSHGGFQVAKKHVFAGNRSKMFSFKSTIYLYEIMCSF